MKNLFTNNPWKRLDFNYKLFDLRKDTNKREKLLTKLYKLETKYQNKPVKETKDYLDVNFHKLEQIRETIRILENAR